MWSKCCPPQEKLYLQDFWLCFLQKVSCLYTSGDVVENENIAYSFRLKEEQLEGSASSFSGAPVRSLYNLTSNYAS